jgi:hypothetical protein
LKERKESRASINSIKYFKFNIHSGIKTKKQDDEMGLLVSFGHSLFSKMKHQQGMVAHTCNPST